jgi:ferredoxin
MRIVHDAAACTGHGRCYTLEPDLFQDDEQGHGEIRGTGEITEAQRTAATRVINSCPERAISLVEDEAPPHE